MVPVFAAEWLAARTAELAERDGGLVIVLDDAHRADGPSSATLRLAARHWERRPVLLIVAYQDPRPGQTSASGVPPVLPEGRRRLFASERGTELALRGFTAGELTHLAVATGHPGLTPDAAAKLAGHADGNPQHLGHLLELVPMRSLVFGEGPLPAGGGLGGAVMARPASCAAPTRQSTVELRGGLGWVA